MRKTFAVLGLLAAHGLTAAQGVLPSYGFDFVTITDVGNPVYAGDLFDEDHLRHRGSVGYEYRISKTEIKTSDWAEFLNAAIELDVPNLVELGASNWGATRRIDPITGRGFYTHSAISGDWPVGNVSWRGAATYCNWLHNGKAMTQEAFLDGAYDTSTFGQETFFTDQSRRSPDARFWIPDLDEWMKAAHWDPNRYGPGEGGWWEYSNSSDSAPIAGIPGVGETNADLYDKIGQNAWQIPVGAYPETQSPWGLLDLSGGASEWTESWLYGVPEVRIVDGTSIDDFDNTFFNPDRIGNAHIAATPDQYGLGSGLRLASAVPAPSGATLLAATLMIAGTRRRQ